MLALVNLRGFVTLGFPIYKKLHIYHLLIAHKPLLGFRLQFALVLTKLAACSYP